MTVRDLINALIGVDGDLLVIVDNLEDSEGEFLDVQGVEVTPDCGVAIQFNFPVHGHFPASVYKIVAQIVPDVKTHNWLEFEDQEMAVKIIDNYIEVICRVFRVPTADRWAVKSAIYWQLHEEVQKREMANE